MNSEPTQRQSRLGSISAVPSTEPIKIERQPTEYPIIPHVRSHRETRLGSISAVPTSESLRVQRQPTEYPIIPIPVVRSEVDRFSLRPLNSALNVKQSQVFGFDSSQKSVTPPDSHSGSPSMSIAAFEQNHRRTTAKPVMNQVSPSFDKESWNEFKDAKIPRSAFESNYSVPLKQGCK